MRPERPLYNRSVRRRWFTILSGLSLLLCAAAAGLWVRGHRKYDHFGSSSPDRAVFVESEGGEVRFEYLRATPRRGYVAQYGVAHVTRAAEGRLRDGTTMPGSVVHFDRWGFWLVTGERWGDDHIALFVPAWFLAFGFMVLPAYWLVEWWRGAGLVGDGVCVSCGYDLRATPERCPECGRVAVLRVPDGSA